ncbi:thermonuclease family protein [Rhizobium leguminosarum]
MRLLGEVVPFISGIDTPEIGSHAKSLKERKLALIAKGRLKELLAERGLRVVLSGVVDKTPSHRPLVNIYRANGQEIGKTLLRRGLLAPRARRGGMIGVDPKRASTQGALRREIKPGPLQLRAAR